MQKLFCVTEAGYLCSGLGRDLEALGNIPGCSIRGSMSFAGMDMPENGAIQPRIANVALPLLCLCLQGGPTACLRSASSNMAAAMTSSSSSPSISLPDQLTNSLSKLVSSPPSLTTVLAVGTAAVAGYCALEQLRFSWWKRGKDGKTLPGASNDQHSELSNGARRQLVSPGFLFGHAMHGFGPSVASGLHRWRCIQAPASPLHSLEASWR
jgi:hypothetical protein